MEVTRVEVFVERFDSSPPRRKLTMHYQDGTSKELCVTLGNCWRIIEQYQDRIVVVQ